jgi:hypothetical protein
MIYTPRGCINLLLAENYHGTLINPTVCTKIEYKGYEISISMDSSLGAGDLVRADIRVFTKPDGVADVDVSSRFLESDERMLYGDAPTLRRVILKIDEMSTK